jgi:hypothetical protein
MAGSQQQPELVAKPGLTLGGITGDGENGYVLSFGDTFKAPPQYTPDQTSEDLEARIAALQSAVAKLKTFLNTYNTNKSSLIEDIKNVRVANVQVASNKATYKPGGGNQS